MIETEVRKHERRMERDGHTCQRVLSQPLKPLTQNAPPTGKVDNLGVPTSTEAPDGPTTQTAGLKRQKDTVNGSANASVPSDRKESRHQGDFTPNFKFGGEIIKTEVRADEKWTDRDGHTSQRVQNRPLDPLTRNVPPTGETDNLQGPICSQNGYLCRNNLETWKSGCKRTIKGGKGQLKQTELRTYLVQSKRTATRAAALTIATQRPQRSHVTRLSRPVRNATQRDSPHTTTHSIVATSGPRSHLIYYVFDPLLICWKKSKIRPTTMQSRQTTHQAPPSAISPLPKRTLQPTHTPPLTKARMALPHVQVLQRTQASHVEWVQYTIYSLCYRYANLLLYYSTKDYSSSGCVEIPTRSLPFFWYLLLVSLLVRRASLCKHGLFSSVRGFLSPQCSKMNH